MQHDRKLTAALLTQYGMTPFVREVAAKFGDNGKLNDIAVITPDACAYVGKRPRKTQRICQLSEVR